MKLETTQIRDRALYESYLQGFRTQSFSQDREAVLYAVKSEAPSFFIPSKQLSLYFGQIERGCLRLRNRNTRRKVMELYRRFQDWKIQNPESVLSRERICEILIDQPAPEYYLDYKAAESIINTERRRALNELIRRHVK